MNSTISVDLGHIARDLNLPPDKVERTVALLDEGNTVPFITRYRKDFTGGLDEEEIRAIQSRIAKVRQLVERKQTILKTIEAQGKLTDELAEQIKNATTPKRLEDLYLPYKPKKQSLASIAREKGLEPLAIEIVEAHPAAADLQARAAEFISAEKELPTTAEVLEGVGHLIAERYSENAELRGRLRRIFHRSGKIVCTKVEAPPPAVVVEPVAELAPPVEATEQSPAIQAGETESGSEGEGDTLSVAPEAAAETSASQTVVADPTTVPMSALADAVRAAKAQAESEEERGRDGERETVVAEQASPTPLPPSPTPDADQAATGPSTSPDESSSSPLPLAPSSPLATEETPPPLETPPRLFTPPATVPIPVADLKKKNKKKKKKVLGEHAFKDYYNYTEPLHRVPPHRVLAINRGDRARAIRVHIEADERAMEQDAIHYLVAPDHPHADFLCQCVRDSLTRLLIPSLEREIRREQTEKAEEHAVEVFVRNLRKLLLQQPVRGRRVLAIDPGFKSGCKMVALDEFGNPRGHGVVYVIGKEDRRAKARQRLAEFARQHNVSVIAIGNGTGCRETEQLVADVLAEELKDRDMSYTVVNEAGASIYSTSPLGREELPQSDALQRGAVSIGRRLLDPLSEMVKINPANLGVGLYQHDLKAKHLQDSLDGVVESCVNFVGVDVNSASPALLRYVSGMNALTARRVYEYRREHGPFKNREELKQVSGFGEATFVQAAGFLKILGGENPLDATWIHPESYDIAQAVLEKLGCDVHELAKVVPVPARPQQMKLKFGENLIEPPPGATDANQAAAAEQAVPPEPETSQLPAAASEGGLMPVSQDVPASTGGSAPEPQAVSHVSAEATAAESQAAQTAAEPAAYASPPPPFEVSQPEEAEAPAPAAETPAESPIPDSPPAETQEDSSAAENGATESPATNRNLIAERASGVDIEKLAGELAIGTHLLRDIVSSLTRPALDPRDNLPPPIFRRGIMKLEDLSPGMELQGTVLNVVDFGVFVDIGLSDSGLVHISRLADRFIKDPHEVVGVGDVLKVWVVDVDKGRRRVSLTAIAPGHERQQRPPREEQRPQRQQQRPQRPQQPRQQQRPPRPQPVGAGASAPPAGGRPPAPHTQHGGGRRDQRRGGGGRPQSYGPKVIERQPTKPKVVKPITKAMEEGKEAMRSFGQLMQLFEKKKEQKPGEEGETPPAES
ncbi:MAG TPA: Tex-like N-terminal domain-containing protein [Pirellulaceae bacterium]|nr:Tex-like N-terminal domain-containing protein [Pirellulaceae bacterium]